MPTIDIPEVTYRRLTLRSAVLDDITGEVIHIGGDGFVY